MFLFQVLHQNILHLVMLVSIVIRSAPPAQVVHVDAGRAAAQLLQLATGVRDDLLIGHCGEIIIRVVVNILLCLVFLFRIN